MVGIVWALKSAQIWLQLAFTVYFESAAHISILALTGPSVNSLTRINESVYAIDAKNLGTTGFPYMAGDSPNK